MEAKKQLIISVPESVHRKLKRIAFFEDTTMTEIIMVKLEEVIAEYKEKHNDNKVDD